MSELPDHEARITGLEAQVGELEEGLRRAERDSAEARVLANGVIRDVAAIRAEVRAAHEEDLRLHGEIRADLANLRKRFGALDQRFGGLEQRVDNGSAELCGRMDDVIAEQRRIIEMAAELVVRKRRRDGGPGHPEHQEW